MTGAWKDRRGDLSDAHRTLVDLVTDVAEIGIWDWNSRTDQVVWNEWHERILGFTAEDNVTKYSTFRKRIHPEDRERVEKTVADAIAHASTYDTVFRMVLPDGTIRHLRGRGSIVPDEPHRLIGVLVNITSAVEAAERERDLLHSLRTAELRARGRLAADLHDGPLQRLFAARLSISAAQRRTADLGTERDVARLQRALDAIDEAQEGVRAILSAYVPPVESEPVDLAAALSRVAGVIFHDRHEQWNVRSELEEAVDPEVADLALQIAAEALHNVRKHAEAPAVWIRLRRNASDLVVTVSDTGVGFDPMAAAPHGHVGRSVMVTRAQAAGGEVVTSSARGAGTNVEIRLPLGCPRSAAPPGAGS